MSVRPGEPAVGREPPPWLPPRATPSGESALFPPVATLGRRAGVFSSLSPDFRRLLRYGRAVDTRRLVEEVGFRPRFDTVAAVEDYARTQSGKRIVPSVRDLVSSP